MTNKAVLLGEKSDVLMHPSKVFVNCFSKQQKTVVMTLIPKRLCGFFRKQNIWPTSGKVLQ